MQKVVKPEDKEEIKTVQQISMGSKEDYHYHNNIVLTKIGEEKMISWTNTFLKNDKGEIVGSLSFGEDVSGKKKEELATIEALSDWSNTFDSMSDGVSIHDRDFNILNANSVICELLARKRTDIIGKKCFKLFHNLDNPIKVCPLARSKQTGQRESVEHYEKEIDKWLAITVSPVEKDGKIVKYIHIVRDITKRKEAEIEMQKQNKELQQFNKLSVGRELRMVELKRKILKLEKVLKQENNA